VLFSVGVALTCLEDGEGSDRSVTFFRRGDWDDLRAEMKPVDL